MRFLADENLERSIVEKLQEEGHDPCHGFRPRRNS